MKLRYTLLLAAAIGLSACGDNSSSRNWGGTSEIKLPVGTKLINATWKEANLWYLTRPMEPGEKPLRITFKESSNLGVFEGTVIFIETAATGAQ